METARDMVFRLLNFDFRGEISEREFPGVYVKYDGGRAEIGYDSKTAAARAYLLLAKGISEGKESFEISQKPSFSECGPMLDVSRGGVMKVESVKKYLEYMAALGMNIFMLYTEDTYEVEGYPYFGYQRGRYTLSELREIDDYADELGIEVIPCIQTLGHMEQYLKHTVASGIADNDKVLLVGEEKTYELISACIKTMRKAFRSNRIHIGCDETHGLGLGEYLVKNGYRDRFSIFKEHLDRVCAICRENGYHPMMWSDMYFTLSSLEKKPEYSLDAEVPQSAIDGMPDVDMVFWDYYHTDNDFYRINIEKHKRFDRKIIFGGGFWTWDGFVPNFTHSYNTMKPALTECIKAGVDSVLATVWSNDGCETSHMLAVPGLTLFSEYCWRGLSCTEDDIYDMSRFISGVDKRLARAVSDFFFGYDGAVRAGKHVLWSDPLINLLCYGIDLELGERCLSGALKVFEDYDHVEAIEYYRAVFRAALRKCRLQTDLRRKYKSGDRRYLESFAEEFIPRTVSEFEKLYEIHKKSWLADYKPQGLERIMGRYAMAIERLKYAKERIEQYLSGEIAAIDELEPDIIHGELTKWRGADSVMMIAAH